MIERNVTITLRFPYEPTDRHSLQIQADFDAKFQALTNAIGKASANDATKLIDVKSIILGIARQLGCNVQAYDKQDTIDHD